VLEVGIILLQVGSQSSLGDAGLNYCVTAGFVYLNYSVHSFHVQYNAAPDRNGQGRQSQPCPHWCNGNLFLVCQHDYLLHFGHCFGHDNVIGSTRFLCPGVTGIEI
jgi:hypothetical protein